ncbi:error-prone DNA polymerase [Hyphomicrobium sp. LHD-15]|uniref:error-prone DNA polymerase n=1 Tax=Hyphomicrobium sp. LHD-15 TaxID=3072142 RepID=UPI00280E7839|nr:error-prone DNA polymerase [Hyphomicrobium sp. LHD-15]MDQ8699609.1 error-prone DNA polymerase [Hyphomicrobium sp. LHD-15]
MREITITRYAELAVTTNFSFLRGASHPGEMVLAAAAAGLDALAITDRNSFAGVVRAFDAWKKHKLALKLIVGVRLVTVDGFEVLAYPTDREAYARLCRLLTEGKRKTSHKEHTECFLTFEEILDAAEGQIFIALPPEELHPDFTQRLDRLADAAPGASFLAGIHRHRGDEPRRLGRLDELSKHTRTPLVAINDVHYHAPERRPLADVVICIREKCTIHEAGFRLAANAERHLKPPAEMARLFRDFPDAISRTLEIAASIRFKLDDLKNEYPDEPVPPGKNAQEHLEDLTWAGARERYPRGTPEKVEDQLREELRLIAKLEYARYFLTVHDVVRYAREQKILCQGRGSAANSAVCYCLGITEIDPNTSNLLFARFISAERREPPDIDVDFEHERREEVIQRVYQRYGREYAAICATVIHYRSRRAIREVGKAMGLTPDVTAALAKTVWGSHSDGLPDTHIREAGFDPSNPQIRQSILLARELIGFPRHLSQHVGGFILTKRRLDETVPIANAAMTDRTFIEWDKDDIDTLGLMKVDVLALGMLSTLRRGLDLLRTHYKKDYALATIPQDENTTETKQVYEMLGHADSVGVFQVESRAQMSMLPRLKPREFYDLVIEVAIVRPGPIQGGMVHPYLKRRDQDPETIEYPSPAPEHGDKDELKEVLKRTRGVPLFQEQAMQIAITAAKFTPDEADGLRRAMATFRHTGKVHLYRDTFIKNMTARGYDPEFVERCFGQIEGFGEYGFPESHAASFALLVYASAWMKCHYPDVFCAAILNSQPMGFYQPAQLVRDAREHGVEVREADVNFSHWDCTLEPASTGTHRFAVRLGLRQIEGLSEKEMTPLIAARSNGYASIERLSSVDGVSHGSIERLAAADAFRSMGLDRRAALWSARRLRTIGLVAEKGSPSPRAEKTLPLFDTRLGDELFPEPAIALPAMPLPEHVAEDYATTGLSLKAHPVAFFRERLSRLGVTCNSATRDEAKTKNDQNISISGLVLTRQMPGGKKIVFLTLEDETGIANIIIWPKVFATNRRTVMSARFLAVRGRLQRAGEVVHILAESFIDLSEELALLREPDLFEKNLPDSAPLLSSEPLALKSRDFH